MNMQMFLLYGEHMIPLHIIHILPPAQREGFAFNFEEGDSGDSLDVEGISCDG